MRRLPKGQFTTIQAGRINFFVYTTSGGGSSHDLSLRYDARLHLASHFALHREASTNLWPRRDPRPFARRRSR
jgi:hypothetical protein